MQVRPHVRLGILRYDRLGNIHTIHGNCMRGLVLTQRESCGWSHGRRAKA